MNNRAYTTISTQYHWHTATRPPMRRFTASIRFKDRKGASRVARNRYTLQEYGSREIIEQNLPWNTTFISGQRVNMSVICRLSDPVNDNSMSSCPKCGVVSQLPCNVDVQCSECNLYYRRVTELAGEEDERTKSIDKGSNLAKKRKRKESGPVWLVKKVCCQDDNTDTDVEDSDEEDIFGFTRVQLIAKQRQNIHDTKMEETVNYMGNTMPPKMLHTPLTSFPLEIILRSLSSTPPMSSCTLRTTPTVFSAKVGHR